MALGSPMTNKFQIGTAELRVGPMTSAMKLLQTHSVGLVDSVTVSVGQESVDLEGGFPKQLMDSAIVRQTAEVSAVLREYSRRNLKIAVGDGVSTAVTDVSTTLSASASAGATSVSVQAGLGASFTAGDLAVIYKANAPENVQIVRVQSISTDNLTLDTDTPLLFDVAGNDPVYVAKQVAIGAVTKTNYMAAMVVQKENATGRPLVWNFWKASIAGNLDYATNADDFASTTLTLKCLQPAAAEYANGQPLAHLVDIIPTHPIGFLALGGS